jgi:hypothetical protein
VSVLEESGRFATRVCVMYFTKASSSVTKHELTFNYTRALIVKKRLPTATQRWADSVAHHRSGVRLSPEVTEVREAALQKLAPRTLAGFR